MEKIIENVFLAVDDYVLKFFEEFPKEEKIKLIEKYTVYSKRNLNISHLPSKTSSSLKVNDNQTEKELIIVLNYISKKGDSKCHGIFGNTKAYKEILTLFNTEVGKGSKLLGYNSKYTYGPGWMLFNKEKLPLLKTFLKKKEVPFYEIDSKDYDKKFNSSENSPIESSSSTDEIKSLRTESKSEIPDENKISEKKSENTKKNKNSKNNEQEEDSNKDVTGKDSDDSSENSSEEKSLEKMKKIWNECKEEKCIREWFKNDGKTQKEEERNFASGSYGLQHCQVKGCHEIYWRGKNGVDCEKCGLRACENCQCDETKFIETPDDDTVYMCIEHKTPKIQKEKKKIVKKTSAKK